MIKELDRIRKGRTFIKNNSLISQFPQAMKLLFDEVMFLRRRIKKLEKKQ